MKKQLVDSCRWVRHCAIKEDVMHIPDGYLGPPTYGSLWVVMLGVWAYASKKVKQSLKTSQVPFLAMASAFSFVAMIFAVPLPGGTTAHITGAALIAILLGPWAAVIAVTVALVIQALMFGDGGVTAIAANCFNMAFVGSLSGYAMFRLVVKAGGHFLVRKGLEGDADASQHTFLRAVGTAVGAYVGINASALLTALELGIQPLLYGTGQASAGYFPYGLKVALPAIIIPHLTLVGALEAVVAVMIVSFLGKTKTGMVTHAKLVVAIVTALFLFHAASADAHDYWIEQKGEGLMLVFGHGSQRLDFEVEKVSALKAFDNLGKEIPVQKEKKGKGLLLKINGQPAMVTAIIDNGYWSKTIYGWKEEPKRKASRVIEAIRQLYYTRMLIAWPDAVQPTMSDHRIALIPLQNPFTMKPGDMMQVKVLYNGTPLPNVEMNGGEHNVLGKTDKDGMIKVPVITGANLLSVEYKVKIKDDPDADTLDQTATLTFEVRK
jgi:cobalt/nickel transport system permease protein